MRTKSTIDPSSLAQVLASVAEGDDLEKVCRRPGIPDAETVIKWIMADSVLTSEFIRARALGGHWRPNAAERIEYGLPPEPVRHEKPTTWRMILAVLFVIVCLPLAIVGAQGHKGGPVVGIGVTVLGVIIIFRWISKR